MTKLVLLFIDLTKAFHCVILFRKLEMAGIGGPYLDIFKDYLGNMKQFLSVGKSRSTLRDVIIGVSQGGCLGPLLFLIYINDARKLPFKGLLSLYADHSGLLYANNTIDQNIRDITDDLLLISEFFDVNGLLLVNVGKTKKSTFRQREWAPHSLRMSFLRKGC